MKIIIVNGPDFAGVVGQLEREAAHLSMDQLDTIVTQAARPWGLEVEIFQTDDEGQLVEALHRAQKIGVGAILNAGSLTRTSIALRDAIEIINIPVVEVHCTRLIGWSETERSSLLSDVCAGTIAGFGEGSYLLALEWFHRRSKHP